MASIQSRIFRSATIHLVVCVGAVIAAFPLLWMVSVSFMPRGASLSIPPPLWPETFTLENYRELFSKLNMGRYLLNSLAISSLIVFLSVFFNAMAGYAFAKLRFRGRTTLFRTLLALLVIPLPVAMLPLFVMMKYLGLINTYVGVVVPAAATIFGIFLVRQYLMSVPDSIIEVARVDGASEFTIFRKIIVPIIRPVLATLAIFTFLASWNDFMWPLIILLDDSSYTLPVALAAFSREHAQNGELMMAGAVVTVVPVLLLFLVLQKYYIEGIVAGSIKG